MASASSAWRAFSPYNLPPLKKRLASGEQLYGAFFDSNSPVVAEILGFAGYDYLVVDLEHGPGGTTSALNILQALAGTPAAAIIRIPANDPVYLKKALDLGPQGIMIPMVDSAKAAELAVQGCRYAPRGVRGLANSIVRASKYGMDMDYLQRVEEDLLIMCQVESREAVENVADIAKVEGVDCIQIGPRDLSGSLGHLMDPSHPEVVEYVTKVEETVRSAGVKTWLAGITTPFLTPKELFNKGYEMVAGTVDVALLREAALKDVAANKPSASF